jgi:hypothetical protein
VKVFLSWSGDRSRLVATALHEWLPQVINAVEPFISSNIDAGARWQSEVAAELEKTDFGILCVTAENQRAPWLNFEAGALAKVVEASRVVPLAIDLRPAEILNPLGQFQAQPLDQAGMGRIVSTINSALPKPLPNERVEKATSKWWPDLEGEIQRIEQQLSQAVAGEPPRSDRELLEDILNTVRSLARNRVQSVDFRRVLTSGPTKEEIEYLMAELDLMDKILQSKLRSPKHSLEPDKSSDE